MSKKSFAVFAIMLLGAAGAAQAEGSKRGDRAPDPAQVMQQLDANGDHRISKREFEQGGKQRAERGERGEHAERGQRDGRGDRPSPEERFGRMDADKDGFLTPQELAQRPRGN
ncbi:hypothetical protein [Paracoccus zeaxanthinifaciens]|uniref:hypothetical protein n=1 Tax=Paracoccus zeaxanthinifaciens TaxID=187400 RepID=UPI0003B73047|nr:hypothetical protein [Paracoccus zeaxanthinifaciens]